MMKLQTFAVDIFIFFSCFFICIQLRYAVRFCTVAYATAHFSNFFHY